MTTPQQAITAQQLTELLTEHLRAPLPRSYEVLLCAGDVAAALSKTMPAAAPDPLLGPGLALLAGINVVITGDSPPGTFRLIRHDACEVDTEKLTVSHDGCSVAAEGVVSL